MDITNRDVREITMSKKPNKEKLLDKVNDEKPVKSKILTLPILIIGFLVVVFGAYMLYAMTHMHVTSKTETSTIKKSSNSEKASSSNKKYVAGKDYKINYNNTDLIDKATIQKGLKASYLTDINDLMNTDEQTGSNMAKIEVYYNKDKNLLVENLFKNGHSTNEATTAVVYDLKNNQIVNSGVNYDTNYQPSWLVYTWERLTK
ncbi:alanyl-tRNA synthetase [Leuconostoc pseudomesenteroides]|uniref:Alanyl-tRNA synthetase n=1 Tax=Leuconostoc pseudomesenteroides TaxID=33968 RepID=A0A1X0VBE8_LEUPS|nr:alanyl-tRNA synthetase [Leuconostoc pseudomesenteroides]OQJ70010.1 alanyl-tRNA synthetase [Leuconostoc pseudomesenteroides]OQJ74350.1 alanyl-tRNA synthetase [Leuconostoc pseudomesenteroides]OQJ75682.1 alanyl-tRNA synthetase [Leuconostoc pseudomesenteroides]ORI35679.1 alanyl-tRNA synthetase [Leuconostoc pseudomesenteroides]ORI44148.1 alanyl-tRNA synthetase [Leuconostoc pseudomesenteroides]